MIRVAAAAGYDLVGLRLLPVFPGAPGYPVMDDAAMMRDTLAALAETGLRVNDIEIVSLKPETQLDLLHPFLEAGQRLGAARVLVAGYDPDRARLVDRFAAFCAMGAEYGLTCDMEFMPWSNVPGLADALEVLRAADAPNAGVLVDSLHFDRSGGTLEQLEKVPREWLHYWQLCDAPAAQPKNLEEMLHTAREERMFPGEGGLDLAALVRAMPPELPVSLEIPTARLALTMGHVERAKRAIDRTRALLAEAAG
jgi:sugar phosphate isomerase/epimerase